MVDEHYRSNEEITRIWSESGMEMIGIHYGSKERISGNRVWKWVNYTKVLVGISGSGNGNDR